MGQHRKSATVWDALAIGSVAYMLRDDLRGVVGNGNGGVLPPPPPPPPPPPGNGNGGLPPRPQNGNGGGVGNGIFALFGGGGTLESLGHGLHPPLPPLVVRGIQEF